VKERRFKKGDRVRFLCPPGVERRVSFTCPDGLIGVVLGYDFDDFLRVLFCIKYQDPLLGLELAMLGWPRYEQIMSSLEDELELEDANGKASVEELHGEEQGRAEGVERAQ